MVPGTGLLAATVPGAWDGWLTLLRDHGTLDAGRGPRTGARVRRRRLPAGAPDRHRRSPRSPTTSARTGRARPPPGCRTGGCPPPPSGCPVLASDLAAAAGRGRRGRQRSGAADRRGPRRVVPRVRRRGGRGVLPHAGAGRLRPRPRRPAHGRRPRRLVGDLRGRPRRRRRERVVGGEARRVVPGPGAGPDAAAAAGRRRAVRRTGWPWRPRCTAASRPPSWRSPTGRRGTATAPPVPLDDAGVRGLRRRPPRAASATRRRWSCARARPTAASPRLAGPRGPTRRASAATG